MLILIQQNVGLKNNNKTQHTNIHACSGNQTHNISR